MNKPVAYWIMLNREQPVKQYTKKEIAEYCKTKPISFFVLPSKLENAYELWLDNVLPKTAIYESEIADLFRKHMNRIKGTMSKDCTISTSTPRVSEYSYYELLEKLKAK